MSLVVTARSCECGGKLQNVNPLRWAHPTVVHERGAREPLVADRPVVGCRSANCRRCATHCPRAGTGHEPDKRSWQRFTWATDLALDNSSVNRVVGLKILTKLAQCNLAQGDEYLLLDVFPERVLNELLRDLPDFICRTAGRDVGSHVTEEHIAAAQLQLVLDEKLGRQTPEVVRHIALLPGIGKVKRKRTDPPIYPSKTVTYEAADYWLPARFRRTGQQAHRDPAIITSYDAVVATFLDHANRPQLPTPGNGLPTRFGRNQQTNPDKAITTSRNAVAATPLGYPNPAVPPVPATEPVAASSWAWPSSSCPYRSSV